MTDEQYDAIAVLRNAAAMWAGYLEDSMEYSNSDHSDEVGEIDAALVVVQAMLGATR
jgi:hypothetical protein